MFVVGNGLFCFMVVVLVSCFVSVGCLDLFVCAPSFPCACAFRFVVFCVYVYIVVSLLCF